jgi:hypothetical protein
MTYIFFLSSSQVFSDALDLSYSLPLLVFGSTSLPISSWKNKSVAKVYFPRLLSHCRRASNAILQTSRYFVESLDQTRSPLIMSIDDFLINPLEGLGLSLLVTSLWEFLSFDDSNLDALSHELVVE